MSNLAELAAEYRREAARLALKLQQMRADGAEQYRVNHVAEVLREMRETAAALSHYHDAPRDPAITGAGYYARKGKRHDD